MDKDYALKQASDIVDGLERDELLSRISALMEKYPDGSCAFVISDDNPMDTRVISITGNNTIFVMDWLLWAGRYNLRVMDGDDDDAS